jgi:hypothetical protein
MEAVHFVQLFNASGGKKIFLIFFWCPFLLFLACPLIFAPGLLGGAGTYPVETAQSR